MNMDILDLHVNVIISDVENEPNKKWLAISINQINDKIKSFCKKTVLLDCDIRLLEHEHIRKELISKDISLVIQEYWNELKTK